MSRIDVVAADKGKYKVLVDYVQRGIHYISARQANREAEKIKESMPHATLNLINEN